MHFKGTLLVCICLKSVLRYKFLILRSCHSDSVYFREQGCEDPWLFFEAKRVPRAKMFGKRGSCGLRKKNNNAPPPQKKNNKKKKIRMESSGLDSGRAVPTEGEGVGFMIGISCHEVIVKLHLQTEVCHCVGPYLLTLSHYSVGRSMYV